MARANTLARLGGGAISSATLRETAGGSGRSLRSRGCGACVTAIAVTDHHDVCMASYVQAAAKRLDSGILVYAGIAFAFGFGDPYLPTSVRLAPSGPMWWHEIKYVGYWPMVRRTASRVRIARGAASNDSR